MENYRIESRTMKILLFPVWMLAVSFGSAVILVEASLNQHDLRRGLIWAVCWLFCIVIPSAVFFNEWQKERWKRIEIEKRWKKSLNEANF